jgi:hypothetical protein
MLGEPSGDCCCLAIRQDVDDAMLFQITDDRAVAMAALPALPWLSNGCAVGTLASVAQSSMPTTRGAASARIACAGRRVAACPC